MNSSNLTEGGCFPFSIHFFSLFEVSPTNRYLTDQSAESTIYTLSTMEGRFQN